MFLTVLTLTGLVVFAVVLAGLRPLTAYLRRHAWLDHPNTRSSHDAPIPRGAGLLLIPVIVIAWAGVTAAGFPGPPLVEVGIVGGLALALGALSWWDDLHGLPALVRLLAHIAAAGLAVALVFDDAPLLSAALPPFVDAVVAVMLWVWFINLFNFMDGIDGISAVEVLCVGGGVVGLAVVLPGLAAVVPLAVILFAALAGFLPLNWHPARIFLGDVGSAPLGFLLGWLLLSLLHAGQWAEALILPAYYLADTTVTLARRGLRLEKVWRPHREHFYQRAVDAGLGHRQVSSMVLLVGVALAALAGVAAAGHTVPALVAAAVLVASFLAFLGSRGRKGRPGRPR